MYGISIDESSIAQLLKDLGALIPGRISFFDCNFEEVIGYQEGYQEKDPDFCNLLKADEKAKRNCKKCDKAAFEAARKTEKIYLYECHAGLTEAAIPVFCDNMHFGYLMLGKLLRVPPNEQLWQRIKTKCSPYNVDSAKLKKAFYELPHMDMAKIHAAARVMNMSAQYIHLARLVKIRYPSLLEQINSIIESKLTYQISLSDISSQLGISKYYLSHLIKSHYKIPLSQYIMKRKIALAKSLLEQTDTSIQEIASRIGYEDSNYFSRIFRKEVGCSPTQYRKKFK